MVKQEPVLSPPHSPHTKLPNERKARTLKFSIGEYEYYATVGFYDDGKVGELFLVTAKEGSPVSGLADGFATMLSMALQHGTPLQKLAKKLMDTRFEPSGFTNNPDIPYAKSPYDFLGRWFAMKFLTEEERDAAGIILNTAVVEKHQEGGAPFCPECGNVMVKNDGMYRCTTCPHSQPIG